MMPRMHSDCETIAWSAGAISSSWHMVGLRTMQKLRKACTIIRQSFRSDGPPISQPPISGDVPRCAAVVCPEACRLKQGRSYEKVFSCSGVVVNVLAIRCPKCSRHLYYPVVDEMKDSFRPS